MNYSIVRIIGDELPPRDKSNNRLKSLQFILDNEPEFDNCTKIWIINQITNISLKNDIVSMIPHHHQIKILEINFISFLKAKTFDEKILALININRARNIGLSTSNAVFTFLFDGDCFFTQELWNKTIKELEQDRYCKKYYGIPCIRSVEKIPDKNNKTWEPMIVFRNDSDLRYNENIPFSKNDRIELMFKIGYESSNGVTTLKNETMCKNIGCCIHISFNESLSESDLGYRMKLRNIGLNNLIKKTEAICLI